MSDPTPPTCPLGLTADDLSAWRDSALAPADERRIGAHVGACPACQRVSAAHDALAAALQADQPPAPDPRNWSRLHARISGERQPYAPAAPSARRRTPRPAIWGGLGAAAAVLLISALFFTLLAQQAQRRGASSQHKTITAATPPALTAVPPTSPIAGPALDWQSHMASESVIPPPGNQFYNNGFAFSPTDAKTAYICSTTNAINAPIAIWATHDGAATWTHVSDLPYISEIAQCSVTVDAADPLRVNVIVSEKDVPSYLSDDGGKTWRTLSDDMQLVGLDTGSGVSVAVTTPWDFATGAITPGQSERHSQLSVSRDDWRTWQPIDGALTAQGLIVEKAWSRPGDGALLVEAARRIASVTPTGSSSTGAPPFAVYTYSLWQSSDLGARWSQFPTPANFDGAYDYVVAQPQGSDPWRVCGFQRAGGDATPTGLIGCTQDGGQTWAARPLPALKAPCGPGCLKQQTIGQGEDALLSDGTLVATFYAGPQSADAVETLSMFHIFRLAPGASQWQDLGSQPGNALVMIGAPAPGTLIGYSGGGEPDGLGGQIVGQVGGDVPNRGALVFATLP